MSIMYVRSHDAPPVPAAALQREPGTFVQLDEKYIKTVSAVIQLMLNNTRASSSIRLLRILAHGNTGGIHLLTTSGGWVTTSNAGLFRAFADRMSPDGRVELHSCGSASDTVIEEHASAVNVNDTSVRCLPGTTSNGGTGRAFIQAMANALGVPCTGALNCQLYLNDWNFEGPTITCYPVSRTN